VLGHKVSEHGIEVDKAKIEVIEQLPPPTNVKGICSFLGHAGFYRCFIKNFFQIARREFLIWPYKDTKFLIWPYKLGNSLSETTYMFTAQNDTVVTF
jgi:hypothetical protein